MAYAQKALEAALAALSGASTSRNIQLNKSAFALGQLIGAQALLTAACSIGLGECEARATIRSGLGPGCANRAISPNSVGMSRFTVPPRQPDPLRFSPPYEKNTMV
jgi:hypothetical protein